MKTFLSYSRKDERVVKTLAQGLEAARRDVWFDHDLRGGDIWWDSILDNIRNSAVFLFALSDASLQSKPCRLELDYAIALGLPILPVQVGPVGTLRTGPLAELQIITYSPDDAQAGFRVLACVEEGGQRRRPLPDPLPPPPPIPFAYLLALGRQIDSTELSPAEQRAAVDQLRRALGDETDETVRRDILAMLSNLNDKPWTTRWVEKEIRALLLVYGPDPAPAGPPAAVPAGPVAGDGRAVPDGTDPGRDGVERGGVERDGVGPTGPDPAAAARADQAPVNPREWFAERLEQVHRERIEVERRNDPDPEPWRPSPDAAAQWRQVWETTPGAAGPGAPWPAGGFGAQPAGPGGARRTTAGPAGEHGFWGAPPPPPARPPAPPTYWALSIVSFLLSLVLGGIAMYFSYSVGQRYQAGDVDGAVRASRNAKVWGIVGIIVGGLVLMLVL